MNIVKISGIVVCFNEERDIENCLTSMLKVCDELVVIDSYSTDRTPEICKSLGVKFHQHPFEGYIEQKVYAASKASSNILLSLDADETLSDELVDSILKVKEDWSADGYYMNRLTSYCGKWIRHSGWYPDRKMRLFDFRKGLWGGTNPHDKFSLVKNARSGILKGDIYHYSFYTHKEYTDQLKKFAEIAAHSLYINGVRKGLL